MLKYLLKEMRVHHYVKNLLVYAALACSGKFFDAEKLMPATLIFGKRLNFRYDRKNPRLLSSSRSTLTIHI